jgi:hypothetical protein
LFGFAISRGLFYFEEDAVRKAIKQEKAHKSCQECEHWSEVKNKLRVGRILAKVIANMEEKLKTEEFKPSLADYLKLVQLEKDLEGGETKEIKVTWVEPVKPSTET